MLYLTIGNGIVNSADCIRVVDIKGWNQWISSEVNSEMREGEWTSW